MSAVALLEEAGVADLLLREWKQGVAEYHSVFFTRRDSGINGISDLPGHIMAFEDPGSTSAYLIPRFTLEQNGIALARRAIALRPGGRPN